MQSVTAAYNKVNYNLRSSSDYGE